MDIYLKRFLLEKDIHYALQTVGESLNKNTITLSCKCLRFGYFENIVDEERFELNQSIDVAWRKF